MPIPPNPYAPAGAPGAVAPNYQDTYPALGLSGLAQGFTHGLELGHDWGNQAEALQNKKDQLANEAAWRESQSKQVADYHAGELKNHADMLDFMKTQASNIGTPVYGPDGTTVVGYQTGKGGIVKPVADPAAKAGAKKDEGINSAAAAYMAMDNARGLGAKFMPESNGLAAMVKSPLEKIRQLTMQTSPENNYRDKEGEAATLFATGINKAGGGRMTETEVANMAKAMGGSGIGDTQANVLAKHEAMKNELAAKLGVSRADIEAAVASRGAAGTGAAAPAAGWSGGNVHVYPDGTKAQFLNGQWVKM